LPCAVKEAGFWGIYYGKLSEHPKTPPSTKKGA